MRKQNRSKGKRFARRFRAFIHYVYILTEQKKKEKYFYFFLFFCKQNANLRPNTYQITDNSEQRRKTLFLCYLLSIICYLSSLLLHRLIPRYRSGNRTAWFNINRSVIGQGDSVGNRLSPHAYPCVFPGNRYNNNMVEQILHRSNSILRLNV